MAANLSEGICQAKPAVSPCNGRRLIQEKGCEAPGLEPGTARPEQWDTIEIWLHVHLCNWKEAWDDIASPPLDTPAYSFVSFSHD